MITNLADKKGECKISCEHGKLVFHDKETLKAFVDKYCGEMGGWKGCTLAMSLMDYFEKKEG